MTDIEGGMSAASSYLGESCEPGITIVSALRAAGWSAEGVALTDPRESVAKVTETLGLPRADTLDALRVALGHLAGPTALVVTLVYDDARGVNEQIMELLQDRALDPQMEHLQAPFAFICAA